ncbi:MAG TPA: hypothetical protein DEQ74_01150 [Wolbachia sp.]|jgi:hypothetical protein|uniref:hypothetical protein n=1 Tax=Wolbachia endosymbiont of Pentalonia nigronervosa TaxID=1301914 RepID=UPI000EC3FD7A|nr:hypothetical protein [Wolbachia endosymbiont of Pentalonia nigronervosa]MBD0391547.1 hypothetical protein [Wolbachia endosymbiont of Pentalonia nigronervosa]HCE59427.1 hypothetical protein [Wolbachia sp.]
MNNIFNKTNAPYLVTGALATLTFLTSGVFAAAPYFKFLAPVASLNVSFPIIIGCAVVSFAVLAFSCVMIARNINRTVEYTLHHEERPVRTEVTDAKLGSEVNGTARPGKQANGVAGPNNQENGTAGGARPEGKASEPVRRTMAEVLRKGLNEGSFKSW